MENLEIKKLFKGGYPSPLLNGLECVNCGEQLAVTKNGKINYYEVMSSSRSTHTYNIVSKYLKVDYNKKIEISISLKDNGSYNFGIAYYKNIQDTQSFRYTTKIPRKYEYLKEELKELFTFIFKNQQKEK